MARPLIRIFVLFVLIVLLAAPWSAAAPRQERAPAPQLLAWLWHQVVALWGDSGCIIDPSGGCRESSAPTSDSGCGMDPGGGCGKISIPAGESGCIADPNGGCRESSAPTGDSGCGIDPHGGCGH